MIKNKLTIGMVTGSFILLPSFQTMNNLSNNELKTSKQIINIKLTNESEFKPLQNWKSNSKSHTMYGVYADNGEKFHDGNKNESNTYFSSRNSNNGKFIFSLPDEFSTIEIQNTIKVSGRYDDYYNHHTAGFIPDRENSLLASQEVFDLRGELRNDNTPVVIGGGEVRTIIDRWGTDTIGKYSTTITGTLNEIGNQLTIQFSGGESDWGKGGPIWQIHSLSETLQGTGEIHNSSLNNRGNQKSFEDFIEYDNEYMNLIGIK